MEERRKDFSQLVHMTQERELAVSLGDLVTIYDCLCEDRENQKRNMLARDQEITSLKQKLVDTVRQHNSQEEAQLEKVQSLQQEIQNLESMILKMTAERELQKNETIRQLNLKEQLIAQIQQKHQQHILQIQLDHDKVVESIKLNDDDYDRKLSELKIEFQLQRDKMESAYMQEVAQVKNDLTEKLSILDMKNRSSLSDLQSVRQELQNSNKELQISNKLANKLKKQLEGSQSTIKTLREELQGQRTVIDENARTIMQLKFDLERANRQILDQQKRVQKSRELIDKLEQDADILKSRASLQENTLTDQVRAKEQIIEQLRLEMHQNEESWKRQLIIQRVKFEELLNIVPLQTEYLMVSESTQYDCPIFKQRFEENEAMIATLTNQVTSLQQQLDQLTVQSQQQITQQKAYYEGQVVRILQDFQQKQLKSQQDHQYQIDQLLLNKGLEIKQIIQENDSKLAEKDVTIAKLQQQILIEQDQQHKMLQDNDHLLEQIAEIKQDHYTQQQQFQEQLQLLSTDNHEIITQMQQEHSIALEKMNQNIDHMKAKLDESLQIHEKEAKIQKDLKQRIDILQNHLQDSKQEIQKKEQQIQSREDVISTQEQQAARSADLIKYLQVELENTKQIYNIFKHSTQSASKFQISDDSSNPIKGELRKMLQYKQPVREKLKVARTTKKLIFNNLSMPISNANLVERQLPKLRSISHQKNTESISPRVFSYGQ